MKIFLKQRVALSFGTLLMMFATNVRAIVPAVDLTPLLANGGFESGNQVPAPGDTFGCPTGWTCAGSPTPGATSYQPSSLQYTPGSDGLDSPKVVPNGNNVATCPISGGSCILTQTLPGTYAAGQIYQVNLWVGTPKTLPDNVTPAVPVNTLRFYFTGTVAGGLNGLQAMDIAAPLPGQWKLVQLPFIPDASQAGQGIGIMIFADGGSSNQSVNLDFVVPPPPPV